MFSMTKIRGLGKVLTPFPFVATLVFVTISAKRVRQYVIVGLC